MNEAQAAQASAARSEPAPIGQFERTGSADHDMRNRAATVDQHANLATNLSGEFGQLTGEFVVEQDVGVEATTEQAIELFNLAGLQAAGVSVDLDVELLGIRAGARTRRVGFR